MTIKSQCFSVTATFLFAAVLENKVDRSVDVLLAGRGCEVHSRDLELCHPGRRPFLETSTKVQTIEEQTIRDSYNGRFRLTGQC